MGEPLLDRHWQLQATKLHELRHLPARDDADAEPLAFGLLEDLVVLGRQLGITENPPDPDVRVKDDHLSASQSSSATGSVGRS